MEKIHAPANLAWVFFLMAIIWLGIYLEQIKRTPHSIRRSDEVFDRLGIAMPEGLGQRRRISIHSRPMIGNIRKEPHEGFRETFPVRSLLIERLDDDTGSAPTVIIGAGFDDFASSVRLVPECAEFGTSV
jgi:hypothetical protein